MNINNVVSTVTKPIGENSVKFNNSTEDGNFKKVLSEFLNEANQTDKIDKANNLSLMLGEADNTHDAMIAAEKADLSLRLTIQIRNKVIDAYNEVMRMQI